MPLLRPLSLVYQLTLLVRQRAPATSSGHADPAEEAEWDTSTSHHLSQDRRRLSTWVTAGLVMEVSRRTATLMDLVTSMEVEKTSGTWSQ